MKPPYFSIAVNCDNDKCPIGRFIVDRKRIDYIACDGRTQTKTRFVCPTCRCWGTAASYKEIR